MDTQSSYGYFKISSPRLRSIPILLTVSHTKGAPTSRPSCLVREANERVPFFISPEAVFTLRSLSHFESLYLTRSSNKVNEVIAQAFSSGLRAPPGYNEGLNIGRAIVNELDSARFDPLLVKAVSTNIISSIEMFLSRVDGMVSYAPSIMDAWHHFVYNLPCRPSATARPPP